MKCRVEGNIFIAPDYNRRPPFSGFLPGVAGLRGCPVWCLYVNRGQCVASFGEDGREGAMMEYPGAGARTQGCPRVNRTQKPPHCKRSRI